MAIDNHNFPEKKNELFDRFFLQVASNCPQPEEKIKIIIRQPAPVEFDPVPCYHEFEISDSSVSFIGRGSELHYGFIVGRVVTA